MKHTISKSDYMLYRACFREFWLKKNEPDVGKGELSIVDENSIEQGKKVEAFARTLFPDGKLVGGWGETGFQNTIALLTSGDVLYEASALGERLYARADILVPVSEGVFDIYEIKSSKRMKADYLHDLAFQKVTFEAAGISIRNTYLVHINTDFRKKGEIQVDDFFTKHDANEEVKALLDSTKLEIESAKEIASSPKPPADMSTWCSNKLSCPYLVKYGEASPDYTIFNIARVKADKINSLLNIGVLDIMDVPESFELPPKQKLQIEIAKNKEVIIQKENIRKKLESLKYPLYFLDYETYAPAIPVRKGAPAHQQMVFQYSLHVQKQPDSPYEHYEFLAKNFEEPSGDLLKQMCSDIKNDNGTVIVWYEGFEKGRNREMADLFPEYKDFLLNVNERVFDLMKVFSEGDFIDWRCKGSNSIKEVLPILAPELSYKDLEIGEGMTASVKWFHWVTGRLREDEVEKVEENLLAYCKQDTWGMVRIFEELVKLVFV